MLTYWQIGVEGMLMGTAKSQRTILTDDGELRAADDVTGGESASPEQRPAVFCTNCGTANQATSKFCRTCGQSLAEQALNPTSLDQDAPPALKKKRFADLIGMTGQRTLEEKMSEREG